MTKFQAKKSPESVNRRGRSKPAAQQALRTISMGVVKDVVKNEVTTIAKKLVREQPGHPSA